MVALYQPLLITPNLSLQFKTYDLTGNCVSQSEKCVCCHFWIVLRMVICSKVD